MVDPKPGDYGVVDLRPRGFVSGLVSALIRIGTRSPWCHAFVVVDNGQIVEATPRGARLNNLSEYDSTRFRAFNDVEPKTDAQRRTIVNAAMSYIGTPYSFLDIVALGLVAVGVRWRWLETRVDRQDRMICSQLVTSAYLAGGICLVPKYPTEVTPEDLGIRLATRAWEN